MTTTNTTNTTSNVVTSATQSLLTSLGTGSGVDTASLVTSLVQAQFANRSAALTTKSDALTAQITGAASLKSAMTSFNTALDTLVKGGTLATQPLSSSSAIGVSAVAGAKLSGLSSSISVTQLATAQTVRTKAVITDHTAPIGTGSFTLTFGKATYSADGTAMTGFNGDLDGNGTDDQAITIDVTNASLDGVAAAINAKRTGVVASVVADGSGGAYLSLRGPTGDAKAFTLAATSDPGGGLSQFNVGPSADPSTATTGITATAQNAKLTVDGIPVERASNTVTDLVDGVKLQLNAVSAAPVTLSSTPPSGALAQAVSDFVDTYNQVFAVVTAQTDAKTGALRSDPAAQTLLRSLKALSSKTLVYGAAAGTPSTLAGIGVGTNRDGTLKLDTTALNKALVGTPDAVEQLFAVSTNGLNGISAAVGQISTAATSVVFGLGASESRYTKAQGVLADQKDKLADQSDAMKVRLTQQFASMSSKVAAYKSTQTFLTGQIAAWNKSDN
ncbi:flagellar filament capping protein FliD [Sphingomonas sp. Tas61C01]|uniref:flagellar filament capping protein FliD n=1 Tax=Sphingomonas sp. Tas61C01 TaxID=3458297 RepID=UPI00403ED6CA